jgi:excisionase family DNA binding protein
VNPQAGEGRDWREAAEHAKSSWATAENFRPEATGAKSQIGKSRGIRNAKGPAPRLALSPDEAAAALGVSRDFFDKHISGELRVVRRGRRKLVDVRELQRWLSDASSLVSGVGGSAGK